MSARCGGHPSADVGALRRSSTAGCPSGRAWLSP
jgi:hypothetical protein